MSFGQSLLWFCVCFSPNAEYINSYCALVIGMLPIGGFKKLFFF